MCQRVGPQTIVGAKQCRDAIDRALERRRGVLRIGNLLVDQAVAQRAQLEPPLDIVEHLEPFGPTEHVGHRTGRLRERGTSFSPIVSCIRAKRATNASINIGSSVSSSSRARYAGAATKSAIRSRLRSNPTPIR